MKESQQLRHIRKFAKLLSLDVICEGEFVNEFIDAVTEAPIESIPECISLIPETARIPIRKYFQEFTDLDYFDTRHMFDKRSHEYKRTMHSHYKNVTQMLLSDLS